MIDITISSSNLINEYIEATTKYEEAFRQHRQEYPNGRYLHDKTPYNELQSYINGEKAEVQMMSMSYIFRNIDLDKLARVVRKWDKRNDYQYCLSSGMEDKLLQFFTTA